MQALKARILEILKANPDAKSPEAETDQILFHVGRMSSHEIREPKDMTIHMPRVSPSLALEAIHIAENRAKGVPLQHLLGYQFFYSHEYAVDSSTLIPRPETEILIDEAIQFVKKSNFPTNFRFAELGLGAGILSCELLAQFKNCSGVASELNENAITLAKENLSNHLGTEYGSRIQILKSPSPEVGFEVFRGFGKFHLILSNPPYLDPSDEIEHEVGHHEPKTALFPPPVHGARDPLYFYSDFARQVHDLLAPGGAAFLEIPHERDEAIASLFSSNPACLTRTLADLTGRPRVLVVEMKSEHR